jgi:hypothetical protein
MQFDLETTGLNPDRDRVFMIAVRYPSGEAYRKRNGGCGLLEESEDGPAVTGNADERDYDIDHYVRQLRQTFASRLACAFTPADYEAVFADAHQMSLFMPAIGTIRTVLEKKSVANAHAF